MYPSQSAMLLEINFGVAAAGQKLWHSKLRPPSVPQSDVSAPALMKAGLYCSAI